MADKLFIDKDLVKNIEFVSGEVVSFSEYEYFIEHRDDPVKKIESFHERL